MPVNEDYQTKFWFQTPEPLCRPGYTGYIPAYGPKRLFQFGRTYGKMTHDLLVDHPTAGLRLARILDCSKSLQEKLEEEALTWKHEISTENSKLNRSMVPGYAGYVPRRRFLLGKAFNEASIEAIALTEKLKTVHQK